MAGSSVVCLLATTGQPAGQSSTLPATRLTAGEPVAADLPPGAVHRYELSLSRGDFVALLVAQRGADVVLTLTGPPGGPALTLDAMDDAFRPERLTAIVESGGTYALQVGGATPAARGAYVVRLDAARAATEDDRVLVEAERSFTAARRLRNPGQAATWPEALTGFQTALDLFARLADQSGVMKTRLEIGITENYLSQPRALESAREAARLAKQMHEPAAVARALRLSGNILVAGGDFAGAAVALDEATAAAASIGHRNSEARGLNDAAIAYRRRGNVEHAVELYERALVLARDTGDGSMEGNILNNLGVAYRTLGETDRAVELFERSLAHRRAAGDTRAQYHALINLSNARRRAGRYEQALLLAGEALEISRTIGDPVREAAAMNAVGQAEGARGRYADALDLHRQALTIARDTLSLEDESLALTSAGRALRGLQRLDEAADVLQEALALSRRMRFPYAERDDLGDLAAIERDRGNLVDAARHLEASVAIDETLRSAITSPELRASFVAAESDRYELYLDVLHQRHLADPAAGHDARALRVSERARARVLLDGLLDGGVDLREGVSPDLLDEERRLQRSLNDASSRLSAALAEGKAVATDELQAAVQRLTGEYARLQADIRRQSPRYADLTQPQPLSAREIQDEVLDAQTVLLEFALGDQRSWLWAVTPESIDLHALPARADIERVARVWYAGLTARQPADGERPEAYRRRVAQADRGRDRDGQILSDMLLGGVAEPLQGAWRGKRLAVVATGVLDILPFNALPFPRPQASGSTGGVRASAEEPLVARHEVVRLPSASVVAAMRRERPRAMPKKTLAILADPVFDRADPRLGAASPRTASAGTSGAPLLVSRNALGRARVGRLPFSREEADAIARLVPAGEALKATGFEATRDTALGPALRDYRIVHFATHGVFDSSRPALSGLIFSLVDRQGRYKNGYVRLQDIYNLRLDAEVVVLSACETALGTEIKGEGLVGLARAFMYAGAPRVVASLWAVDDLATAELMTRFYRGMLQGSLPAAAALQAAQRSMRSEARWRDPYYWAGFTLVGDWR